MTTTFTTNKNFALQGFGDNVNTWGTGTPSLNNNWSSIDGVLGGLLTQTLSNANVTLTQVQANNALITFSGTLSANVTVSFPAIGGSWLLTNSTTGNFTLTIASLGGGSSYVLPRGTQTLIYSDAVNIVVSIGNRASWVKRTIFTSTTTYTSTPGVSFVYVQMVGGGGGGGGVAAGGTSNYCIGGGGSAGGYAAAKLTTGFSGGITVTIGAAGSAGAAGGHAGGGGGTTSFGSLLSVTGGSGGGGPAAAGQIGQGGPDQSAGGGSPGPDFKGPGGCGFAGGTPFTNGAYGGYGGASVWGGNAGAFAITSTAASGTAGRYPGDGGAGGVSVNSASTAAGGAGHAGQVVIDEYF